MSVSVRPAARSLLFVAGACLVSALFAVGTLGRAHQKIFWHDEIYTAVIAALPASQVWSALRGGLDLNPPGFYFLTQASQRVFGAGLIGTRMPAIVGVLLASLCVGLFVRRRIGAFGGLSAMLLLLCTDAYFYSYEARPYGPVLGLAGTAIVCWQSAIGPPQRRFWLVGLFVSLTIALTQHYYATLLFVPIILAEAARLWRTRQPDWPLWITIGSAVLPLLLFIPLVRSASRYSAGYFAQPSLRTVLSSYESTISELAVPLVLMCLLAGTFAVLRGRRVEREGVWPLYEHEWVLGAGFVLLPCFTFVLAEWTRALEPRYYLPWTIGLSILVPFAISQMSPLRNSILAALMSLLFLWFGARQALSARWLTHDTPTVRSAYPLLFERTGSESPVVIGHPHVYLVAAYYARPDLQSRLVTLTPPADESPSDDASDTAIRGFHALERRIPIRLEPFDEFTAAHDRFFVYGPPSDPVVAWLRARGASLVLRGEDADMQLFPMSRPGPYTLFEVTLPGESGAARRAPRGATPGRGPMARR